MAFNTGNPLGSTDPRDLSDNSENFDRFANGTDPSYSDRLGNTRKSFSGMESDFQQFLLNSGYEDLGTYAAGIEVTARNQIILDGGEYWRVAAGTAIPYTTTGAGLPEGGAFVAVGDAVLRQELDASTTGQGSDLIAHTGTSDTVTEALDKRTIYVGSVAELEGLTPASDGTRYSATRFRPGSDLGGGEFYWDSTKAKSDHNGIDIIDPGKAFPADFEVSAQVDAWLTADGVGTGCFIRADVEEINAAWAGLPLTDSDSTFSLMARIEELVFARKMNAYFPSGTYDIGDRNFPFRNAVNTSLRNYGGARVYGDGRATVFKTTSDDGADVLQLNAVEGLTIDSLKVTATLTAFLNAGSNGISITNGGKDIVLDVICEDLPYVDKTSYLDGGKALTIQPATSTNPLENITANIVARNVGYGFGMDIDNDALINAPIKGVDVKIFCDGAYRGVSLSGTANASTVPTSGLEWGVRVRGTTVNCQKHYISNRAWGADVSINIMNTQSTFPSYLASDTERLVTSVLGSKNERLEVSGLVETVDVLHRMGGTTNGGGVNGGSEDMDVSYNVDFQSATTQFDLVNSGGNTVSKTVLAINNVTSFPTADFLSNQNVLTRVGILQTRNFRNYNTFEHYSTAGVKSFGLRSDGNIESTLTSSSALGAYVGKKAEYDETGAFLGYRPIYA